MMKLSCFAFVALVFTNVRGQGNGAVRLFNNGKTSIGGIFDASGIVEVYYNSEWNTVCDTGTGSPDQVANTICRQLSHDAGGRTIANSQFGVDPNSPGFSSVSCDDSDITLLSCEYDTTSIGCTSSDYLAVQCIPSQSEYPGKVVLRGFSAFSGRGHIETYCNDEWGLVCNDGFTKNDADTVCRQLGYTEAASYGKSSGDSSESVWFDNPGCSSKTKCLSSCHSCPSSSFNCSVSNVAGVMCSYKTTSSGDAGRLNYCDNGGTTIELTWVGIVAIIGVIVVILVCVLVIVLICCYRFGVIGVGARARRPQYSDI